MPESRACDVTGTNRTCGPDECKWESTKVDVAASYDSQWAYWWRTIQIVAQCGSQTAAACAAHGSCEGSGGGVGDSGASCTVTAASGADIHAACSFNMMPDQTESLVGPFLSLSSPDVLGPLADVACNQERLATNPCSATVFSLTVVRGIAIGQRCAEDVCLEIPAICETGLGLQTCAVGSTYGAARAGLQNSGISGASPLQDPIGLP